MPSTKRLLKRVAKSLKRHPGAPKHGKALVCNITEDHKGRKQWECSFVRSRKRAGKRGSHKNCVYG